MLEPLPRFPSVTAHHCISGSVWRIYLFHDYPVSEEMLLGLGGGVGFIYWHMRGQPPFIGGRANARGDQFELLVGERTGVKVETHTTSSAARAERALLQMLQGGEPVMMMVDMGFLPYFDFGGHDYHFGGHAVVAAGYDAGARQVLIADRDGHYPVRLEILARARGSTYRPFPPLHRWYTFDFSGKRPISAGELRRAIVEQVEGMLHPPIQNFGVAGIRKAAQAIPGWPRMLDQETLRVTLFNCYAFIDAKGGTGGGIFRYMFSRFLREAATMIGEPRLEQVATDLQQIGDRWQVLAEMFRSASAVGDPAPLLTEMRPLLLEIAGREEVAWGRLGEVV